MFPRRWLSNVMALLLLCGHVSCEKEACSDPGTSPHGERFGHCCSSGSTLHFSCKDNYELVGYPIITCIMTGLWSARRPLCRPLYSDFCEFPDLTPHARLRGKKKGDYFVPGEKVRVRCKPGYRLEGDDDVECGKGGMWTKEFGVCKEIFCESPLPVANGVITEVISYNRTSFPYGSDIHYVCDKGYRIEGGDDWRTCIGAGVWSGRDPGCKAIHCQDPGTPENGMRVSSHYAMGSRIRFGCNDDYELKGAEEILCQANAQWAGEITWCDPSDYWPCGLGKEDVGGASSRIVGGQAVTEPWPWMAALFMTQTKGKKKKTLQCGGSVVHHRFILTAAHCMYYPKSDVKRKPSDITVKLGLVHVSDTEHVQQLKVRKIHIHDNFYHKYFDYDAALLELQTPIKYNSRVFPICLPPKDLAAEIPFYLPQSKAWTAGWGDVTERTVNDQRLAKSSDVLKEIQLDIQPRETCRKSLERHKNKFTDRMFCAGPGEGMEDTCLGDSGGPVMQRHLQEAGHASWTQVGIVSWGMGCGLKGEYGMYANLQLLMPWVHKTVRKHDYWNR